MKSIKLEKEERGGAISGFFFMLFISCRLDDDLVSQDRVALTGVSPVKAPTPPDVRFSASGG